MKWFMQGAAYRAGRSDTKGQPCHANRSALMPCPVRSVRAAPAQRPDRPARPAAPSAPAVAPAQPLPVPGACTAHAAALVFLAGDAETIAARILDTVTVDSCDPAACRDALTYERAAGRKRNGAYCLCQGVARPRLRQTAATDRWRCRHAKRELHQDRLRIARRPRKRSTAGRGARAAAAPCTAGIAMPQNRSLSAMSPRLLIATTPPDAPRAAQFRGQRRP